MKTLAERMGRKSFELGVANSLRLAVVLSCAFVYRCKDSHLPARQGLISSQFLFAPESPWWLVRKGKHDRALKTLDRLSNHEADNESTLALIQHTVELERALKSGGTYWDCFKGTNLRRTELAIAAWLAQELTGFALPSGAYCELSNLSHWWQLIQSLIPPLPNQSLNKPDCPRKTPSPSVSASMQWLVWRPCAVWHCYRVSADVSCGSSDLCRSCAASGSLES